MEMITYEPKDIDLIDLGAECPNGCRHCFYSGGAAKKPLDNATEMAMLEKFRAHYPTAKYFAYPMDILTSRHLIPFLGEINQEAVLNNGIQ
jgi:hypothetical protein